MKSVTALMLIISLAWSGQLPNRLNQKFQFSHTEIRYLFNGRVISEAHMESLEKQEESLELNNAFLHPASCNKALQKLSQYEQFQHFINIISESKYDNKTQKIFFRISHSLFPKSLTVSFKIARITKPGVYNFEFPSGFLKNLKGEITIELINGRCFMGMQAQWQGKKTPFPLFFLESAIMTLNRIAMEKLIRISR